MDFMRFLSGEVGKAAMSELNRRDASPEWVI